MLEVDGKVYPKHVGEKPNPSSKAYHELYSGLYERYKHAVDAGYDAPSQLIGMDKEGIDVAAYLFFSGDGADLPADLLSMIEEFEKGAEMVIGNRTLKLSNWKYQGSRRAFPNVTLAAVTN